MKLEGEVGGSGRRVRWEGEVRRKVKWEVKLEGEAGG